MGRFLPLVMGATGGRKVVVTAYDEVGLELGARLESDYWEVVLRIKNETRKEKVLVVGTCFRGLSSIRPDYELVKLSKAIECENSARYDRHDVSVGGHYWVPVDRIEDTSGRPVDVSICPFCATVRFV